MKWILNPFQTFSILVPKTCVVSRAVFLKLVLEGWQLADAQKAGLICTENILSLLKVFHIKKITTFLFFITLFFVALGQDAPTMDTEQVPLLENIHLHLNKTVFFKGEHLWFKAYVQDQYQQLPSSTTTNLHVGIFSKDGKVLIKKIFFVNNGSSYGDFKIDSTFVEGSYALMAWTNYMKNFEFATPFLQKITIIGPTNKPKVKAENGMTILVHPEGQKIMAGTFNSVGLMVFDEALNPLETKEIQLVTGDGDKVQSNIQTNELGQGRFVFFANPTKSYFIKIKDANGAWVTKELENKLQQGIGVSVDNTAKDVVVLSPKWSKATFNSREGARFSMAIFNHISRSFVYRHEIDGDSISISVDRYQIPSGINTAMILDEEMRPLSQRMFFNRRTASKKVHSVEVDYCLTKGQDSLQLDVILPKGHKMANLSMSVLPANSSACLPNNSIVSSFLVQPYLEKQFVKGPYFFEGTHRSSDYQLDTRLLMEGTEKFDSFRSMDVQNTPYEMEKYIAFNGKILDADLKNEKQVSLMSQTSGAINLFDLSKNKNFKGNLPLFEGDSILVSVLDEKGKLRKPKAELHFKDYSGDTFDYTKWLANVSEVEPEVMLLEIDHDLNLSERTILLDEVVVLEKMKDNTKFQITALAEGRIIDKGTVNRYRSFQNYVHILGFHTRLKLEEGGIGVYILDPPGLRAVPVFVEGMVANPVELMNMPLSSIKSIVYSKSRQGPFISLSLRYDYDELYDRVRFASLSLPEGFSRAQSYFSPNYPDYTSFLYKRYGAIWWESQLGVNSEVPHMITVPLNEQKKVKIIIEGMSANGILYHTEQICSPFENNYSAN